jgi:hypothetical protein
MPNVTTERHSLVWARLLAIIKGTACFVPAFLLSLPFTVMWVKHRYWAGEPQAALVAIFPSFVIGVIAAILRSIYLLMDVNLRNRESNWQFGGRNNQHEYEDGVLERPDSDSTRTH